MSLWRKFPKSKVPWYIASQLAGGILAAALAIWMHGQQRTSEGAQLLSHLTSTQGWAALGQADHVNLKHIYLGGLLINLLANVVVWAGMGSEDPHVPLTYTPLAAGIASGLSWISAMGIETNFAYAFCLGMAKSGSSQPYLPHADYSSLFVSGSFGLLATLGAVAVSQNWRERSVELKPVTMSRKGSCTPRYFEN
jgi:fluoride ion exporter CrcB/FEX